MPIRLFFDMQWCTGCMNCRAACIQRHAGCSDPNASALIYDLEPFAGNHRIDVCRQCESAACAMVCPSQAISRQNDTGIWTIDRNMCVRCGACVEACPFRVMSFSPIAGPVKCDLCGGDPRCVAACHFGVIQIRREQ